MEQRPERNKVTRRFVLGAGGAAILAANAAPVVLAQGAEHEKLSTIKQGLDAILENPGTLTDEQVEKIQRIFEMLYGIRVEFAPPTHQAEVFGDPPTPEDIRYGLVMLHQSLQRYPRELFMRMGMPRIIFMRNVLTLQDREAGEAGGRIGLSVPEANWFAVDPSRNLMDFDAAVHHELFHVISARDRQEQQREADQWLRLTEAAGSAYGPRPREEWAAEIVGPFVNGYGATDPYEDQAMFAYVMLIPAQHGRLLERIELEPDARIRAVFRQKHERMRRLYEAWSGGAMNAEYWQRNIDAAYAAYSDSRYVPSVTEGDLRDRHSE